jgi:hypothetical protein
MKDFRREIDAEADASVQMFTDLCSVKELKRSVFIAQKRFLAGKSGRYPA